MKAVFKDQFTSCTQDRLLEKKGTAGTSGRGEKGQIYDTFEGKMRLNYSFGRK